MVKKIEITIDIRNKALYNIKACKQSDEVECGYSLTVVRDGGNFYGVCHGLDQAVSFIEYKSTYPKDYHAIIGFYIGNKRNTRVRLKLPTTK